MADVYRQDEKIEALIERFFGGVSRVDESPLESASTTLFPRGRHKGQRKWYVESNTAEGLKRLHATEIVTDSDYDVQSELDDPDSIWIDPPVDEVDQYYTKPDDRPEDVATLVERLQRAKSVDRRQLVIEAEAMSFEGQERDCLVGLLKEYIEENRDNTNRDELVAVAAAIRKCVALLDTAELDWLATLLESGHRVQPSLDAELEIAKMVFRRYSQAPPETSDPHPELSERLAEMAADYLRPRVFNHARFSTVAMLAVQALLVVRSQHAQAIIDQVNELPFAWFRQQLYRRMDKVLKQMPSEAHGTVQLRRLIDGIQTL